MLTLIIVFIVYVVLTAYIIHIIIEQYRKRLSRHLMGIGILIDRSVKEMRWLKIQVEKLIVFIVVFAMLYICIILILK